MRPLFSIYSNSTPGVLFRYPFSVSAVLQGRQQHKSHTFDLHVYLHDAEAFCFTWICVTTYNLHSPNRFTNLTDIRVKQKSSYMFIYTWRIMAWDLGCYWSCLDVLKDIEVCDKNPKNLFSGGWEVYDWLSFCTGRASIQQFNLVQL